MKILVIGELCVDIFEYGFCNRLNPEAPTPVFVTKRVVSNAGMAGNVAKNLDSLECGDVEFFSQKSEEKIAKHRFVEENSNYILLRVDKDGPVSKIELYPWLIDKIREADAVVVSDYDKGFLDQESMSRISREAKLSFLDTKKALSDWASEFSWIKINKKEYENPAHNEEFLVKHENKIIVTMGGKGARIGKKLYEGTESEVKDVVGAGDSFLASFSAAQVRTGNLEKSINFANLAGSHAVKKKGVSDLSEIKEVFKSLSRD
jgi:D-beta-D-heptose 7-phosphate kinase/D-beta-D-heptose 1-phosphate adenosyltransferase